MQSIFEALFICVIATVLACIEIESEGKFGWADKMPTWYRSNRWYNKLFGDRPITGYHTFMFMLPVLIFHAHFAMGMPWSWQAEVAVWPRYFIFIVIWDYYWFLLNPYYEGKFAQKRIWWHAKDIWFWGRIPFAYLSPIVIATAIPVIVYTITNNDAGIRDQATRIGIVAGFTSALWLSRRQYHQWYRKMRRVDDRDKTDIFYN